MNLKSYIELRGIPAARALAERAGTSYPYLWQCAHGIRRPSVDMAKRLVVASGNDLDFVSLLAVEKREEKAGAA